MADTDAGFTPGDAVGIAGGEVISDPTAGDAVLVVSDLPMTTGNDPEYGHSGRDDRSLCVDVGAGARTGRCAHQTGDSLVATADGTAVTADHDHATAGAPVVGRALDTADLTDDTVDAFVTLDTGIEGEPHDERPLADKVDPIDELEAENERRSD